MKDHVKQIIEKDVLSFWDFKTLLEYIASALEKNSEAGVGISLLSNKVSLEVAEYIDALTRHTSAVALSLEKFNEDLASGLQRTYDEYEKKWGEFVEKRKRIDMAYREELTVIPEIKIPHNWKEYLDFAERLSNMPESHKNALIDYINKTK